MILGVFTAGLKVSMSICQILSPFPASFEVLGKKNNVMVVSFKRNLLFNPISSYCQFTLNPDVNAPMVYFCPLLFQDHFFNEFAMDGLSAENDEIFLEIIPDNLLRSLKTAQNAKSVKIKLTKKHCPCLTFQVELVSLTNDPFFCL